jgi:hypothetical protein
MAETEYQFGQNKNSMKKEDTNKARSKVETKDKRLRKAHFLEDWKTRSVGGEVSLFPLVCDSNSFCGPPSLFPLVCDSNPFFGPPCIPPGDF